MSGPEDFLGPSSGPIGSGSSGSGGRGRRAFFRADLHVHSRYSGAGHLRGAGLRISPGEPEAIYRRAKSRGMDLVTLTDINTIDGCLEFLDRHPDAPDFMISEEVTAFDPRSGRRLHVLLYGIREAHHHEVQRLKGNLRELLGYARQEGIVSSLSAAPGSLPVEAWAKRDKRGLLDLFEHFEVKNGMLARSHNELAARVAQALRRARKLGVTAGSGAHGPSRVGRTVTLAAARTPREFLAHLRDGRTWASGADGTVWTGSGEIARTIAFGYRSLLRERPEAAGAGGRRQAVARTLVSAPLHLVGAPYLADGLRRAWAGARVRRARRWLDRLDRRRFQRKVRSFTPASDLAETKTQRRPGELPAAPEHSIEPLGSS